ncbi:uncharacterized protein FFB20_10514 [Fusarium fujikuroi]|uniref:Uncharacterized protein n=1 Tax=Fusarium fujikuroi TaxID=5127 RepID=A0A9Q9S073_FUSFU|nr:uncharacterized protein FFB20_10514 [Fusarium fujikuroi]SCO17880.1 uncharacterized protein FFE2_13951 [Fusarium fujikuroi]SCO53117.1 uncharacterized protein FFNC_14625 [Fusarium fujikuroi]VTT74457.1 unnamed protein product [Fusarium fujikuroi]VTT83276.1 unnamed protein product [Fusarium fujikuroi]
MSQHNGQVMFDGLGLYDWGTKVACVVASFVASSAPDAFAQGPEVHGDICGASMSQFEQYNEPSLLENAVLEDAERRAIANVMLPPVVSPTDKYSALVEHVIYMAGRSTSALVLDNHPSTLG